MGNGLTYAQKLAIARQTELTIGVDTGFQKAADFFSIALYEEGFGEQRQEKSPDALWNSIKNMGMRGLDAWKQITSRNR